MFFKHKHFTLDTVSRSVSDENSKQLYITGNAYVMLEFLCKHGPATILDVNDAIDFAAQLNEDDIRQLRYKIKTALGHNIISYKNHIYSIDGEVTSSETNERASPNQVPLAESGEPKKIAAVASESQIKVKKSYKQISVVIVWFSILAILIGGYLFYRKQNTDYQLAVVKHQGDTILIPAGDFLMGSTEKQAMEAYQMCQEQNNCVEEDYLSEYPQHTVLVPDFYIDKKEVSNADYQLFIQATNRAKPQYWSDSNLNQSNQPVVGVDWNDAQMYCQWVGERLPTEAEWEKAARGTDGRIWPWGSVWDGSKLNHGKGGQPGLDGSDGYEYLAPVGVALGISPYGVLNMAGNVDEWVSDTFGPHIGNDKFIHSHYNQGLKIIKGGSYDEDLSMQRTATRTGNPSGYKDVDVGFRCAKDK